MNELKEMSIWIPYLKNNGKKPSLDGKTYAKWSDRSILLTFKEAINLLNSTLGLAGVGFVIPLGYVVIDLDQCYPDKIPVEILNKFNSYSEISPSGNGIHIIVKSNIKCKKWTEIIDNQPVEYLTPGNFVTFTGNTINHCDIKHCDITHPEYLCASHRIASIVGGDAYNRAAARTTTTYGQAALNAECSRIRRAYTGSRTYTIYGAAVNIGELIAGGEIEESNAIRELERAGRSTGQPSIKLRRNIEDGITEGKKHPRTCGEIKN